MREMRKEKTAVHSRKQRERGGGEKKQEERVSGREAGRKSEMSGWGSQCGGMLHGYGGPRNSPR